MPPPLPSLYTLSFLLALLTTLLVAASLRLLAILSPQRNPPRRVPTATRILVVLGSGGHTHEMFRLLRDLDTRKYTHRTYVVGSGDAFSARRAVEFERGLEGRRKDAESGNGVGVGKDVDGWNKRKHHIGPEHYDIRILPRARKIHQSILTTPFTCLVTLLSSFPILLSPPPDTPRSASTPSTSAATHLPSLIITNGPATSVILILASLVLKFFDIRGAQSRGMCKTIYVESFARVERLSLSGWVVGGVVERFLVQWEGLEGCAGGRGEFWGVLV